MSEEIDINSRRGVLRYDAGLIEDSQCREDLLAVLGRIIPTRVEHIWCTNEFDVYFVSPDVPPVGQGMVTPRYNITISWLAEDGTKLNKPRLSFCAEKPKIGEYKA